MHTGFAEARIINMVTDLVTAELAMQWPVTNGQINPDVDQDVIKVAAIDRAAEARLAVESLENALAYRR